MIRSHILPLVLLGGLVVAGTGCSGARGLQQITSAEAAFTEGKDLFDRGRHMRAIEYFQRVFDFGRGHVFAPDAQFYLAQSYFKTRQYLLAANEFTRFVEFYRNDPRVEEGDYMRALSYVRLSPPYQLDQTDTHNALTFLRLYLGKHPEGKHSDEVIRLIDEMRHKLARKQFEIAELYETRGMNHAAAIEFLRLLETYPDSEFADNALFGALRNYRDFAMRSIPTRRVERLELAAEQYTRLAQLFPNSDVLPEARVVYQEVQDELRRLGHTAAR